MSKHFERQLVADRAIVHAMMARYFDTIGRVDLATYFDLPRWLVVSISLTGNSDHLVAPSFCQ